MFFGTTEPNTLRGKLKSLVQKYLYGQNVNLSYYYLFIHFSLISLKIFQRQLLPKTTVRYTNPSAAFPFLSSTFLLFWHHENSLRHQPLHSKHCPFPQGTALPIQETSIHFILNTWLKFPSASSPWLRQGPSSGSFPQLLNTLACPRQHIIPTGEDTAYSYTSTAFHKLSMLL